MPTGKPSIVLGYHERTKHRLERYAAGPETLDWDAQPDPFRRFAGAPVTTLPLTADADDTPWANLFSPGAITSRAPTLASVGLLFELSFALSAWKQAGPDRWALRCNPSSGNLHPTEVYLLTSGIPDIDDGLYHYAPKAHALERRARFAPGDASLAGARMLIGFSSIYWREAWKYGERAFRYCQLDMGHATGALRYAAAVTGWRIRETGLDHATIAALLGLDREEDFGDAEHEEPEALFELLHVNPVLRGNAPAAWPRATASSWQGRANRLDPRPMYRWPAINEVARNSRQAACVTASQPGTARRSLLPATAARAATLIRARRSAQRFDPRARLDVLRFWPMMDALMPSVGENLAPVPWDTSSAPARVHAVLFAHRINGLEPGAYLLLRDTGARDGLQNAMPDLPLKPVSNAPVGMPFHQLAANPALARTLRTLSCHQAIAADALFVVALLADLRTVSVDGPERYRELLRESGLIGHTLYLEAEAAGLRGTGIGCYFDDAVHELLGLDSDRPDRWQVLYHFSVGVPLDDPRIVSEPPYRCNLPQEYTP
ncbi:nitroreductase family protein [Paraburkholderia unamae]|uniref:SagB-type dehydrogenase family enzyme n=1 Tax=Paraburkholderia unamae TaxID=219649 RepID=A0ABX5KVD4_9BURK|nr:nitroreductase family protein [Paraburkholderia unamae]PVX85465.1 SagB-type dehydrogenase family enzyme [Paraburkholderia unamae]